MKKFEVKVSYFVGNHFYKKFYIIEAMNEKEAEKIVLERANGTLDDLKILYVKALRYN